LILGAAGVAVVGYLAILRERQFRQLIAEGDAALARDDTFVAIESYTGAITLKPGSMLSYLRRGETYQRRGDVPAAQRDLRHAVELDPSAGLARERLGDLSYAQRRFATAAEHYAQCVSLDDESPRVQYKLGLSWYRAGRPAEAAAPLARAVALDERFAEAHYLYGLTLRDLRRVDGAIAELRRAVALSPAMVQARTELADLYQSLGSENDALRELEALAALEGRPERQVALGLAYARSGEADRAVLTLSNAVERFPEHTAAYIALGRVWLESASGRDDRIALRKAVEALEGAIAAGADGSQVLTLLGRAELVGGSADKAERLLKDAASRVPLDPDALLFLADAAERLGHIDLARRALVSYRTLEDEDAAVALGRAAPDRIARLAAQAGLWAEAAVWYRRAAAESDDAQLLGRLADAEWRAGDLAAARGTLARALMLAPRDRMLNELAQRMR
jgi:tetratricopeptide (TPR) repeat protein